jgi:hypothetical protein
VDWIKLTQDIVQLLVFVNKVVMELWVTREAGISLPAERL